MAKKPAGKKPAPKRKRRPTKPTAPLTPPEIPPPPPPHPVPPNPDQPLDDEERLFVAEYLVDRRSGAAYRRSHPLVTDARTCRRLGSDMRNRPHVDAEIRAAIRCQMVRLQVTADEVLNEVRRVAMSDIYDLFNPETGLLLHPRDIPLNARRAVASLKLSRERRTITRAGTTSTTVTESIVEIKLWSKTDALGKLMAHFGLTQAVPPLEVMLSLLPRDVADQVRELMLRRILPQNPVQALASPPVTASVPVEPQDLPPQPPEAPQ